MTNTVSRILSDETLNRIIQIESAGKPDAKAPTSSAAGLGQFILGTWNETIKRHRPDLFKNGAAPSRVGVATAALQVEMLARFTEDNAAGLGAGYTDGDLYLAHFLGLGDARKLFRASPGTLAASVVSAAAVSANKSILVGKTCAQVRAWAQASMEQRWVKAGKPDWVKKYAGVQIAAPPDVPPVEPKPKPKVKPEDATAGGVVVAGGAAAQQAGQAGASATTIAVICIITIALTVGGYFAIRWWRNRKGS